MDQSVILTKEIKIGSNTYHKAAYIQFVLVYLELESELEIERETYLRAPEAIRSILLMDSPGKRIYLS